MSIWQKGLRKIIVFNSWIVAYAFVGDSFCEHG